MYAYNETQYEMLACSAKFRSLGTDDEARNTIKVLECEIAEVDVGRRMRKPWGRCSVGRVGHGPPKILVGCAAMHLAPPIIGLYVR